MNCNSVNMCCAIQSVQRTTHFFKSYIAKPAAHAATCVQCHLHSSPDHLLHLSNTQLAIVFDFCVEAAEDSHLRIKLCFYTVFCTSVCLANLMNRL